MRIGEHKRFVSLSVQKKSLFLLFMISILIVFLIEASLLLLPKNAESLQKNYFTKPETSREELSNLYFQQGGRLWGERIETIGAQGAYGEFKETYKSLKSTDQHRMAHVFGEILYMYAGIDGVSVCDEAFFFGCYHSFLGTALQYEGLVVLPSLNELCNRDAESERDCQHGIGHGVLTFLGYRFPNLVQALERCFSLRFYPEWCFGGVFMEYNFQTMLADEGRVRVFQTDKPFYPCIELDQAFRPACYFSQPQWWLKVLKGSAKERFGQIGNLCKKLEKEDQKYCFSGSGDIAGVLADYDVEKAISLCESLSTFDGSFFCRAEAARVFFTQSKTKSFVYLLCENIDSSRKQSCLTIAGIER